MSVAIAAINCIDPGRYWSKSWADLLLDAALPIVSSKQVDVLICCGSNVSQRQANVASIAADRLGLRCPAITIDAGDISGSMALLAGWQFIRGGLGKTVLVLGAAKLSDLSESERAAILDSLLDQEAALSGKVSFAAQAGLLAGSYCRLHDVKPNAFARIAADNLRAWADLQGTRAPTADELAHDLMAARPLVRSDFAQLLDGAGAVLLTDARDSDVRMPLYLEAVTSSADVVSPWDRRDPFTFDAVSRAVDEVQRQTGSFAAWVEIDAACSVAQYLTERAANSASSAIGKTTTFDRINVYGGCHGRGRPFGVSGLYQLHDVLCGGHPGEVALALAVSGLGSNAVASIVRREAP
jgi:acetyl-CoA acetyltransferase